MRARLEKQREKLAKQLSTSRNKLQNEKFVARAKPEVVDKARQRLAELEAQLAGIDENVRALGT